jgi:phosphonoacetaldehyde hydrolase
MCFENAKRLGVWPMEACVKVDDTIPGIEAGLNAGMWSIGVVKTGNEIGLSESEIEALPPPEREQRLRRGRQRMLQSGAHYVIDGVADLIEVVDEIETRLQRGERP